VLGNLRLKAILDNTPLLGCIKSHKRVFDDKYKYLLSAIGFKILKNLNSFIIKAATSSHYIIKETGRGRIRNANYRDYLVT